MDNFIPHFLLVKRTLMVFAITAFFSLQANAQSLEERLEQLSQDAAQSYVKPVVNTFGANLNSGWFYDPPKAVKKSFDIEFGMVGMGSYFKDEADFFEYDGMFRFDADQAATLTESIDDPIVRNLVIQEILSKDYNVTIFGPSITGSKTRNIKVTFAPDGSEDFKLQHPDYPFPVYLTLPTETLDLGVGGVLTDYPVMPTATPQIKLGTLYGTRAIVRFLPSMQLPEDLGELNFYGFGLQHNPAVWFDYQLPVDVSLGFMTQRMYIEDLLDINAMSYGLNLSKTFEKGFFSVTPFAGFMIEKSTVEVTYSQIFESDAETQEVNINFEMDGENTSRFNTGLYLHLGFINLFGTYNFATYNSFTGGLSFSFGK